MFPGKSESLAQVLDDALHLVGGDGPREDGVFRPEVPVHPLYQLVPEAPGEVQVDVRQRRHILGDETLQCEVPHEGVHVADADEIPHQQGHRRTTSPSRRTSPPWESPGPPVPAPP